MNLKTLTASFVVMLLIVGGAHVLKFVVAKSAQTQQINTPKLEKGNECSETD